MVNFIHLSCVPKLAPGEGNRLSFVFHALFFHAIPYIYNHKLKLGGRIGGLGDPIGDQEVFRLYS